MKTLLALVLVGVFLFIQQSFAAEKYTTKYDNIDIKNILNNKRLLKAHHDCLMNRGTCTSEGAELKRVLPEALKTKCAKCTPIQKQNSQIVLKHLYENESTMFRELEKLYDPEGVYRRVYVSELEAAGYKA